MLRERPGMVKDKLDKQISLATQARDICLFEYSPNLPFAACGGMSLSVYCMVYD